jgi:hypothetical protein
MTTIVCVHGRRQHGKNPAELRKQWVAGLNLGLAAARRPRVDPAAVRFPFYGNHLEAAKNEAIRSGDRIDLLAAALPDQNIDPLMPEEVARVETDLLQSLGEQIGIVDYRYDGWDEAILLIPGARRILKAIADHTGVDQEVIESFLTDVAVYFTRARNEVLKLVREEVPDAPERLVIIAHSLGSLVAHDLLQDRSIADRTDLLVTAGSPLGLQGCHRNLLAGGPIHPAIDAWVTAYDPQDIVTLGHPLAPLYGEPLDDLQVDNPFLKAHSIEKYLSHAQVAAHIGDALA